MVERYKNKEKNDEVYVIPKTPSDKELKESELVSEF